MTGRLLASVYWHSSVLVFNRLKVPGLLHEFCGRSVYFIYLQMAGTLQRIGVRKVVSFMYIVLCQERLD